MMRSIMVTTPIRKACCAAGSEKKVDRLRRIRCFLLPFTIKQIVDKRRPKTGKYYVKTLIRSSVLFDTAKKDASRWMTLSTTASGQDAPLVMRIFTGSFPGR